MIPRDFKATPIVVICRDRFTPVRELLCWLTAAGYTRPILLDNASTYPPLVDFLATTDAEVVRLGSNMGHLAPWSTELRERLDPEGPFVVTDCDVVPDEDCPADVVEHLAGVLLRYANVDKVGLGLRIDDLPDCYALKAEVLEWESLFWESEIAPGVFQAGVDTTFALYRSPAERHSCDRALRTGAPYRARHLPWYADSARPTDEQRYYLAHADLSEVNWGADQQSENLRRLHEARGDDAATRQLVRESASPILGAWVGEPAPADKQAFTPLASDDSARANLTILDSKLPGRLDEFKLWLGAARPGSVLLIHDASNGHGPETAHHLIHERIAEPELSGVFLQNPRGGVLAIKTREATLRQELAREREARAYVEGQLAGLRSSRAYRLIGLRSRMLRSLRRSR